MAMTILDLDYLELSDALEEYFHLNPLATFWHFLTTFAFRENESGDSRPL